VAKNGIGIKMYPVCELLYCNDWCNGNCNSCGLPTDCDSNLSCILRGTMSYINGNGKHNYGRSYMYYFHRITPMAVV